jgi:hypothetical protein
MVSKRRKFIADGVFFAELNDFFTRELASEVRHPERWTPAKVLAGYDRDTLDVKFV